MKNNFKRLLRYFKINFKINFLEKSLNKKVLRKLK